MYENIDQLMVKNKQFRRVSDILYEDRTKLLSVSDKKQF